MNMMRVASLLALSSLLGACNVLAPNDDGGVPPWFGDDSIPDANNGQGQTAGSNNSGSQGSQGSASTTGTQGNGQASAGGTEPARPIPPKSGPPTRPQPPKPKPASRPKPPSKTAVAFMKKADQQMAAGDYSGAAATLERALRIEPRSAELWQRLAGVRLEQGRAKIAETFALKSNSFARGKPVVQRDNWKLIATARRVQGDYSGARSAEQKASAFES